MNNLVNSTVSNYILLLLKLVLSLLLVRIMFLGISNEEYGFWALLWSIFGYSLLLDFGFGTAIQKATSEFSVKKDIDKFNKIVSTVFFSYCLLSSVIILFTVIMMGNISHIFTFIESDNMKQYELAFLVFGLGTAIIFPFGFFREILRGLQEITIRNNIDIVFLCINFALISSFIYMDLSIVHLAGAAIFVQFFTNMCMCFYVYKKLPEIKISIHLYRKKEILNLMGFSLFAYMITFSNIIIFRTDQLIISIFATVGMVALYQVVSRVSDLFKQFSTQIHDIIGPISAVLFFEKDSNSLRNTLLYTNKIVGIIATILIVPFLLYTDKLLYYWLKIEDVQLTTTAMILLISMYILVFFRSSSVQVLLMCNRHKELTYVAIAEALLNLVLSIYLIQYYSIIGVALGTLIPNLLIALVYNLPVACKFSNISIWYYLYEIVLKNIIIGVVVFMAFYTFTINSIHSFIDLILYGSFCVFVLTVLFYIFLPKHEKVIIKNLFLRR